MTDGIYLFSIYDDPTDSTAAERGGTILPSSSEFPTSRRSKRRSPTGPHAELAYVEEAGDEHGIRGEDGECEHEIDSQGVIDILMSDDEYDDDIEADDDGETPGSDESGSETIPIRGPSITQPLVHPRRRYAGACNVEVRLHTSCLLIGLIEVSWHRRQSKMVKPPLKSLDSHRAHDRRTSFRSELSRIQ